METVGGDNLDCGNVIGCLTDHIVETLAVTVPWMSWIFDEHVLTPRQGSGEHLTRVYGHRLELEREAADLAKLATHRVRWASIEELQRFGTQQEQCWVAMWQGEYDEDGLPVRRTYGYRGDAGKYFSHNGPGNPLVTDASPKTST